MKPDEARPPAARPLGARPRHQPRSVPILLCVAEFTVVPGITVMEVAFRSIGRAR